MIRPRLAHRSKAVCDRRVLLGTPQGHRPCWSAIGYGVS